jgi:hypothetical protein
MGTFPDRFFDFRRAPHSSHGLSLEGYIESNIASGTSYNYMWKVTLGLSLWRPILVAFYTAVYLVPFTFPAMFHLKAFQRRMALIIAIVAGVALAFFSSSLLQPGPLNSSFVLPRACLTAGLCFSRS